MGLTYAWLLSQSHEVTIYARPETAERLAQGVSFDIQDLRDKLEKHFSYVPRLVADIDQDYDTVLVMVNRLQMAGVLPLLQEVQADIVFMLNHWDIEGEVRRYLSPERYLYGFPSQVGGGREDVSIDAVVFPEATILGEADGSRSVRLTAIERAFQEAGLTVEVKEDILAWLKVHYLQQSISAGAIAKAGSYAQFADSYPAVKEMVYAFREGLAVCEALGVDTRKVFPASMFRYPALLVAWAMRGMFRKPETVRMVTGHMKQGMPEWIAGFREVLADGERLGVEMPVWRGYLPYVDAMEKRDMDA